MKLLNCFSVTILSKHNKIFRRVWELNTEPFDMNFNTYPQRYAIKYFKHNIPTLKLIHHVGSHISSIYHLKKKCGPHFLVRKVRLM